MGTIGIIVFTIIIAIIILLLTRELWCWYWKINEMKELLKSIDQKLSNNVSNDNVPVNTIATDNEKPEINNGTGNKAYTIISEKDKASGFYICANCGRKNPIGNPKCIDCQTPKKEE